MSNVKQTNQSWNGMVPIEDTALFVTDSGGPGVPIVYLNGSYASQSHWKKTIADLGPGWRHIAFDERARGRSKRSSDYSFEACIRDLDAVLAARRITERALLVGWSYGAYIAAAWAARNPERALGIAAIEGAFPWGWTDAAGHERVRKLFRQMGWSLPFARLIGSAAGMSAEQHAEINIETHKLAAAFDPVLDRISVPLWFVFGTGKSLGGEDAEFAEMRASIQPALTRNPHLQLAAELSSNHQTILSKDFRAIAGVARAVATIGRRQTEVTRAPRKTTTAAVS